MKPKTEFKIRNVHPLVRTAISMYCKDKGITQANYLENDKRIKSYLEQ